QAKYQSLESVCTVTHRISEASCRRRAKILIVGRIKVCSGPSHQNGVIRFWGIKRRRGAERWDCPFLNKEVPKGIIQTRECKVISCYLVYTAKATYRHLKGEGDRLTGTGSHTAEW